MQGIFIPKGTLVAICSCGVPVYRVGTGENEVVADCETKGSIRPKSKMGGAGYVHVCKQRESA